MKTPIIFLLTIFSISVSAQTNLEQPFVKLLNDIDASFVMPEGFIETHVKQNTEVFYQYAIKDSISDFEIRYFIRPYKISNTENLTKGTFASTILNACGGMSQKIPVIEELSETEIKKEFNANWGATSAFKPTSVFGGNFNFCSVQAMKKNKVGEIYIFWMFTDVENQEILLQKSFKTIIFN